VCLHPEEKTVKLPQGQSYVQSFQKKKNFKNSCWLVKKEEMVPIHKIRITVFKRQRWEKH
jgi:hypothetical protein